MFYAKKNGNTVNSWKYQTATMLPDLVGIATGLYNFLLCDRWRRDPNVKTFFILIQNQN